MKKFITNIVCMLLVCTICFLTGCTDNALITKPDPNNENIMLCNKAVPVPNNISIFKNNKKTSYQPDSENYSALWQAINTFINKNPKSVATDSLLELATIDSLKQNSECIEFSYLKMHKGTLRKDWIFKSIFFHFEAQTFRMTYIRINEAGEYAIIDEQLGALFYPVVYEYSKHKSKIDSIESLI